jgi:alpha-glucosidase (family GH31 glycosyl hydrolase)
MKHLLPTLLLLTACKPGQTEVGYFSIHFDRETALLDIAHAQAGPQLTSLRLFTATVDTDVEMQFGSFRFTESSETRTWAAGFGKIFGKSDPRYIDILDENDAPLGLLMFTAIDSNTLLMEWSSADGNRIGWSAACDDDEHFLALGAHAMDVDHVGQRFDLFVAEPGIGKSETEDPGESWQVQGGRHDSSYPVPFTIRPQRNQGLVFDTTGRLEVDLCATDSERFEISSWEEGSFRTLLIVADSPLDVLRKRAQLTGLGPLAPPWVFGPWLDAIRGSDNVRALALKSRASGAPVTAIWTEDWKGATENALGYHLTGEMTLDTTLYPDGVSLAQELEEMGIKWLAYFSSFVAESSSLWEVALEADVLIQNSDNEPYTFFGATLDQVSLVDLSTTAGRDWIQSFMLEALAIGFDGWMADYAEWLPPDAVLASGQDAMALHNRYPEWWQETNLEVIEGTEASFFARSGWLNSSRLAPIIWAGDQQTDFSTDDGLPTVIPMGLGVSTSGSPVFTHDIGGYSSGAVPSADKELSFRSASLGAFSPIMRTHHGAWDTENWDYDSDEETWGYWTTLTREHMRLFPYRYGLASQAATDGTPMLLPISFVTDSEDWGRLDAWMLGEALLVAPVVERDARSRYVDLPSTEQWVDWWTLEPATSGYFSAALDEIPVFARGGTTVPTFDVIPQTLQSVADPDIVDLDQADRSRLVYLFGSGSYFEEADGTSYRPQGSSPFADTQQILLTEGTIEVGGLQIKISGPIERTYTAVVVPTAP